MRNIIFQQGSELSYDKVAEDFFDALYMRIMDGKISAELLTRNIACNISTFRLFGGEQAMLVVQNSLVENRPAAFEAPLPDIEEEFNAAHVTLMEKGIDPQFKEGYVDRSGTIIKHFAQRGDFEKVIKILEICPQVLDPELLHNALKHDKIVEAEMLIKRFGINVNARNSHGSRPPISYARSIQAFNMLLINGADPTIIDEFEDDITYFYGKKDRFNDGTALSIEGMVDAEPGLKQYAYGLITALYIQQGKFPIFSAWVDLNKNEILGTIEPDMGDKDFKVGAAVIRSGAFQDFIRPESYTYGAPYKIENQNPAMAIMRQRQLRSKPQLS